MTEIRNDKEKTKNKDKWNCHHHMPLLPLWGIMIVYRY